METGWVLYFIVNLCWWVGKCIHLYFRVQYAEDLCKEEGTTPVHFRLEDLRRAVDDVINKKKTFRQASEYYGVPTAVIFHRIKGRKVSLDKMGGGVTKALPDRLEGHLANCLKTRARMGNPCHKEELKLLVGEYVTQLKIKTPFKNNIPGDCWYQNFMKRHPDLSLKKLELYKRLEHRREDRTWFMISSIF